MFHLIIGFIYFVCLWSSWRVGGVPLGRGPSSLGYFALYPWVVVGVSLGTSCLLLACLLFAPCLPRRKNASLQGGGLFRVSRLGRYIGWAAFLGRLVMVFFGGDGHSSSQGKSPGAAHMSAPGCLVVCCSICQARRHFSLDFAPCLLRRGASPQLGGVSKKEDYSSTFWVRLAQERILMVTARLFTSSS